MTNRRNIIVGAVIALALVMLVVLVVRNRDTSRAASVIPPPVPGSPSPDLLSTPTPPTVSQEQVNSLHVGMSLDDLQKVLGPPPELTTDTQTRTKTATYFTSDHQPLRILLLNDKVMTVLR
jgi:outer membrane protein assembly factor BamE (lipoprotein component of BamABCDE complex)